MAIRDILDNAIKDAKVSLYRLLLSKQTDKLTDNEVDLGYLLAKMDAVEAIVKELCSLAVKSRNKLFKNITNSIATLTPNDGK